MVRCDQTCDDAMQQAARCSQFGNGVDKRNFENYIIETDRALPFSISYLQMEGLNELFPNLEKLAKDKVPLAS
jgi:hypothetical protein